VSLGHLCEMRLQVSVLLFLLQERLLLGSTMRRPLPVMDDLSAQARLLSV
jgi:hypothetical protein